MAVAPEKEVLKVSFSDDEKPDFSFLIPIESL